jgi:hypothetical protein
VKLFIALLSVAAGGVAFAQLTQPVPFGDAVVVERSSPGLVPSMKFNNINVYSNDLSFVKTLASIPLLRAPGAIAFSASGDIYLVEPCDPSCVQIGRHEQSGSETPFGDAFHDSIQAMQFIVSGDLIVEFSAAFGRLDANGRLIRTIALPTGAFVFGFDVDRDQCTVVFSTLRTLETMNICSADPKTTVLPLLPPSDFFGVRFLPNGNILAGSRGLVYELDRRGAVVRRFVTWYQDFGEVAIDPDEKSFWTTAGNRLLRVDLITGAVAGSISLRNAAYGARSMAVRGEWRAAMNPLPRRRSAGR